MSKLNFAGLLEYTMSPSFIDTPSLDPFFDPLFDPLEPSSWPGNGRLGSRNRDCPNLGSISSRLRGEVVGGGGAWVMRLRKLNHMNVTKVRSREAGRASKLQVPQVWC